MGIYTDLAKKERQSSTKSAPEAQKTALEAPVTAELVSPPLSEGGVPKNKAKKPTDSFLRPDKVTQEHLSPEKRESKQANNIAINIASNITILQNEIDNLLSVAYKAQTFRFTPEELRQLRDVSYSLSNMFEKKIGQADLLRLGFLLLRKLLESNREEVIAILQTIKK